MKRVVMMLMGALAVTASASAQTQTQVQIKPVPVQAANQETPMAPAPAPDSVSSGVVIKRPVSPDQDSIAARPVPPPPDTAADQELRKQADAALAQRAADVADTCDAEFSARIDWTKISAQDIHLAMPENTCGAVLDAMQEYCETSDGRERVSKSIKGIICTAGQGPVLSLRSGTLLYTLDWQSQNPAAFVYAWLAKNL
jgi:hypothetical protein